MDRDEKLDMIEKLIRDAKGSIPLVSLMEVFGIPDSTISQEMVKRGLSKSDKPHQIDQPLDAEPQHRTRVDLEK